MQTTFKLFLAFLLCFSMPLVSGCSGDRTPRPTPAPVDWDAPDLDELEEAAKAATTE